MFLFLGLALWLLCSKICSVLASNRGRDPVLWFFLGLFFGIFPIFALLIMAENEDRLASQAAVVRSLSAPREPQPVKKKSYTPVSSPRWPE
jgi:hypothetical protein